MGKVFKLQNGLLLLSTEAAGGIYTTDQLRKISDICDRESAFLKATEDQRLVISIASDRARVVANELKATGLGVRHYQDGLHQPVACIGALCSEHQQDALAASMDITTKLKGVTLQNSLKIGINGCARSCVPAHTLDISVVADTSGYRISLGGKNSQIPEMGSFMAEAVPPSELPILIEKIVHLYKEHSSGDETLQEVMERVGTKPFIEVLLPYSRDAHSDDSSPFGGDESNNNVEDMAGEPGDVVEVSSADSIVEDDIAVEAPSIEETVPDLDAPTGGDESHMPGGEDINGVSEEIGEDVSISVEANVDGSHIESIDEVSEIDSSEGIVPIETAQGNDLEIDASLDLPSEPSIDGDLGGVELGAEPGIDLAAEEDLSSDQPKVEGIGSASDDIGEMGEVSDLDELQPLPEGQTVVLPDSVAESSMSQEEVNDDIALDDISEIKDETMSLDAVNELPSEDEVSLDDIAALNDAEIEAVSDDIPPEAIESESKPQLHGIEPDGEIEGELADEFEAKLNLSIDETAAIPEEEDLNSSDRLEALQMVESTDGEVVAEADFENLEVDHVPDLPDEEGQQIQSSHQTGNQEGEQRVVRLDIAPGGKVAIHLEGGAGISLDPNVLIEKGTRSLTIAGKVVELTPHKNGIHVEVDGVGIYLPKSAA